MSILLLFLFVLLFVVGPWMLNIALILVWFEHLVLILRVDLFILICLLQRLDLLLGRLFVHQVLFVLLQYLLYWTYLFGYRFNFCNQIYFFADFITTFTVYLVIDTALVFERLYQSERALIVAFLQQIVGVGFCAFIFGLLAVHQYILHFISHVGLRFITRDRQQELLLQNQFTS